MRPYTQIVKGPAGSRFDGTRIRVVALELKSQPEIVKLSIQAMEGETPIAEHPLHVEWMPKAEFKEFLENSHEWGLPPSQEDPPPVELDREYFRQKLREHRERKKADKLLLQAAS